MDDGLKNDIYGPNGLFARLEALEAFRASLCTDASGALCVSPRKMKCDSCHGIGKVGEPAITWSQIGPQPVESSPAVGGPTAGMKMAAKAFFDSYERDAISLTESELVQSIARYVGPELAALNSTIDTLKAEVERLTEFCGRQRREIEDLNDLADCKETLRQIGKAFGCDHVESKDERAQLINCAEHQFTDLESMAAAQTERAEKAERELDELKACEPWREYDALRAQLAARDAEIAELQRRVSEYRTADVVPRPRIEAVDAEMTELRQRMAARDAKAVEVVTSLEQTIAESQAQVAAMRETLLAISRVVPTDKDPGISIHWRHRAQHAALATPAPAVVSRELPEEAMALMNSARPLIPRKFPYRECDEHAEAKDIDQFLAANRQSEGGV